MYVLLSRDAIDGELLCRYVGYEILESYYALQDILESEAKKGYDFYDYYYLVLKLKPLYRQLSDESRVVGLEDAEILKPVRFSND